MSRTRPARELPADGGRTGRARQAVGRGERAGESLPASTRAPFERFFGADFSRVRVHDDAPAHESAAVLNARAFTQADRIYFGRGQLDTDSERGRNLLGHELAHVVQHAEEHDSTSLHRQPLASDPEEMMCRAPVEQEPLVCEGPPPPASLGPAGALEERVAAFKALVKRMAIHRLTGNRQSLLLWAALIEDRIPDEIIAAAGLEQSGGYGAYMDLQDIRNPATREVVAWQAIGRYRACTGCHLLTRASAWGADQPQVGPEWMSPNERRRRMTAPDFGFAGFPGTVSGGYTPPVGTSEGALMTALPEPGRTRALIEQARPIFQALGPSGYRVLPQAILDDLAMGSMASVRRDTIATITQRRGDYLELIQKIENGDLTYDKFGPIINDLLPLADADVRAHIQEEMDDNAFWDGVEAVVIGVLSIAALLLIIFPPTSALGIALAGALEVTLATYALATGPEMMSTGRAYSLGEGANNVFTPAQQQAGGMMMLTGFIGVVLAPLGIVSGGMRMATGISRMMPAVGQGSALLRAGQTIERGEWVVTMAEDGALIATSTRQPELMIIVRGDTATLYQSMGPGGMRVVASTSVSESAAASTATAAAQGEASSMRLLGAGSGPRTAAQEYDDFMQMLSQEGATGPVVSGDPVTMVPHAGAREARDMLGLTGQHQSAHGFPQSVGAGLPGYNPRHALTTLHQRAIHSGMDAQWKAAFQALRRQGRTTASAQEVYDAVAQSIRASPDLPAGMADTLALRLYDEMFVELGLAPGTQLPLPYPNITP